MSTQQHWTFTTEVFSTATAPTKTSCVSIQEKGTGFLSTWRVNKAKEETSIRQHVFVSTYANKWIDQSNTVSSKQGRSTKLYFDLLDVKKYEPRVTKTNKVSILGSWRNKEPAKQTRTRITIAELLN
jgi:hypothetical protein